MLMYIFKTPKYCLYTSQKIINMCNIKSTTDFEYTSDWVYKNTPTLLSLLL